MTLYFRFHHSCLPQKTLTLVIQTATRVHRLHHRLHHSAPLLTHRFTLAWCDFPCSLLHPLATVTESRHVPLPLTTVTRRRYSLPLTPASLVHRQQPLTLSSHKHQPLLLTLHILSLQPLTAILLTLHHPLPSSTTAHF